MESRKTRRYRLKMQASTTYPLAKPRHPNARTEKKTLPPELPFLFLSALTVFLDGRLSKRFDVTSAEADDAPHAFPLGFPFPAELSGGTAERDWSSPPPRGSARCCRSSAEATRLSWSPLPRRQESNSVAGIGIISLARELPIASPTPVALPLSFPLARWRRRLRSALAAVVAKRTGAAPVSTVVCSATIAPWSAEGAALAEATNGGEITPAALETGAARGDTVVAGLVDTAPLFTSLLDGVPPTSLAFAPLPTDRLVMRILPERGSGGVEERV